MALRFTNTFSSKEIDALTTKSLYFRPVAVEEPRRGYRNYSRGPKSPPGQEILALYYDEANNEVYLPLDFGLEYAEQHDMNSLERRHCKVNGTFTASLFPHQEEDVQTCLKQLRQYRVSGLHIHTGYGKTRMISKITAELGLLTIFITPISTLMEQTAKTYETCTTLRPWIYDPNRPSPKGGYDVIICLIHRVEKLPEHIKRKIGFVFVDEAHMFLTQPRIKDLLSFTPRYLVMGSATLEKPNQMHRVIEAFVGTDWIVHLPQGGRYIVITTTLKFPHESNRQGILDWPKLESAIHTSEERNELILQIIMLLAQHYKKIMVATIRKDHAKWISESLTDLGYDSDYMSADKSTYRDCHIFVGSYKKTGTGFDQAMRATNFDGCLFEALLNVSSIKEDGPFQQLLGRLRNRKGVFYQLLDNDTITQKHNRKNQAYLKSIGAQIIETSADDLLESGVSGLAEMLEQFIESDSDE